MMDGEIKMTIDDITPPAVLDVLTGSVGRMKWQIGLNVYLLSQVERPDFPAKAKVVFTQVEVL